MTDMTPLKARNLAVDFVAGCISQAEADGYQQLEDAEWQDAEPAYGEVTASSFVVTMGGHRIIFRATIEKK